MIVYTKRCLCKSRDRERLKELRLKYPNLIVKNVNLSKEYREAAISYNMSLPIYVIDGVAYDFYKGE